MRLYWIRILALAQVALTAKHHLDMLEADERRRVGALAKKSRGRPWKNLSANEREEMLRLVRKMEPGHFGRDAAMAVARGRKPKP
jgi:predicted ArsR family transcriptional regulator